MAAQRRGSVKVLIQPRKDSLATLYEPPARPCSRCGTELLLHWHGPLMTGVWMELCLARAARRPRVHPVAP